jgi:hypothetical protein
MTRTHNTSIVLQKDGLCVPYADGTCAYVAPGVLLRSELIRDSTSLEQAVQDGETGMEINIVSPGGYLETWVRSLRILEGSSADATSLDTIGNEAVLQYLKVRRE